MRNRRAAPSRLLALAEWLWLVWFGPLCCVVPAHRLIPWTLSRIWQGRGPPGVPASTPSCICLPGLVGADDTDTLRLDPDSYPSELAAVMSPAEFRDFVLAFNSNEDNRAAINASTALSLQISSIVILVVGWAFAFFGALLLFFESPVANWWYLWIVVAVLAACVFYFCYRADLFMAIVDETVGFPSAARVIANENMRAHRRGAGRWRLRRRVDSITQIHTWVEVWPFKDPERERLEPLWHTNPDMALMIPRSLLTPFLTVLLIAAVIGAAGLLILLSTLSPLSNYQAATALFAKYLIVDVATPCRQDARTPQLFNATLIDISFPDYKFYRHQPKHRCWVASVCCMIHIHSADGTSFSIASRKVLRPVCYPSGYAAVNASYQHLPPAKGTSADLLSNIGYLNTRRHPEDSDNVRDVSHLHRLASAARWSATWRIKLLGCFLTTAMTLFAAGMAGVVSVVRASRLDYLPEPEHVFESNKISRSTMGAALLDIDIS